MITATICAIGDELLIGQVKDTNSAFISSHLNAIGVKVTSIRATGDNEKDITDILHSALEVGDILIFTGGLGPTKDDRTKNILFKYSGATEYVINREQEQIVKAICERRKMPYVGVNDTQPMVPNTAKVIVNKNGTAPGMWFEMPHGKVVVSLPGVPFETEILTTDVCNMICDHYSLPRIIHKSICTFGIAESVLAKQIEQWEDALPEGVSLAYLPGLLTGVKLRLSSYGNQTEEYMNEKVAELRNLLGDAVYALEDIPLERVVSKMLVERGETLATAESCTGGNIAHLFTSIEGASTFFNGSVVAYQNFIKHHVLGVEQSIIDNGVVSKECVEAMALGVQKMFNSTYAIATSGVAGPTGGTKELPVGTVWIGIAGKHGVTSQKYIYSGRRLQLIDRFSSTAINLLRLSIEE